MAFHVAESARMIDGPGATRRGSPYGAFAFPSPEPGWHLTVLADDGTDAAVPVSLGWEHVSVHAWRSHRQIQTRTPTWREMTFIKAQFWEAEDVVIQYHPRASEYVNLHPNVLHLWRYTKADIPTPPPLLIGPVPA